MADIKAIDVQTGQPVSVPQEAAASQYKAGKIKFAPGTRVPIKWNGVTGTVPAEHLDVAVKQHGAELHFDPWGGAKAFGAAALSSATLGGSDWAAVEGSRLMGGDESAENTKSSLRALREDHPQATVAGDLTGAAATLLIPGEEEVGLAKAAEEMGVVPDAVHAATDVAETATAEAGVGAREASSLSEAAGPQMAQAEAGANAQLAKQVAQNQALSGATKGSLLARTLRATNPYTYVGRVGRSVETGLGSLLGENMAGRVAPGAARYAAEGAVIGLADAADEDEIGEPGLTAEAYLANAEHGALWGSALGLVGTGASRILTGAGRMAGKLSERITEAGFGGSPREMGAAARFGRGTLAHMALQNGYSPLMTAEQKYRWAQSFLENSGVNMGRVLGDHGAQVDLGAEELLKAVDPAIDAAAERYAIAGGSANLAKALKRDLREAIGYKNAPEAPEPIMPHQREQFYEDLKKEYSVPEIGPMPKRPKPITDEEVIQRHFAESQLPELGMPPKEVRPLDVKRRAAELREQNFVNGDLTPSTTEIAQAQAGLQDELRKVSKDPKAYARFVAEGKLNLMTDSKAMGRALIERYKTELTDQARAELGTRYGQARHQYDLLARRYSEVEGAARKEAGELRESQDMEHQFKLYEREQLQEKHEKLQRMAMEQVQDLADERLRTHLRATAATQAHNANLKIHPQVARNVRIKWDKLIPYNRSPEAIASAAIETKLAGRMAMENKIEEAFDKAARKTKNPELLGDYLHAKQRYAIAKDIATMTSRGERRAAGLFGRISRVGGTSGAVFAGVMAAAHGHPIMAVLTAAGGHALRHYAAPVSAYVMHKAAKLAELKAIRQEYLIGHRRALRAAVEGNVSTNYARVKIAELPPHELRATAAEVMAHVYKMAGNTAELRSRIAAYDPALPLVAPKTFVAVDGHMSRAITNLAVSIPPKVSRALSQGEVPTARDLTDHEARDFLTKTAVTVDPRYGSDALSKLALTSNISSTMKLTAPHTVAFQNANLKRMATMDRGKFDYLPPMLKSQLRGLAPTSDPAFASALQISASIMNASNAQVGPANSKGSPTGMAHASATSKGMGAMVSLSSTTSEQAESGPPGRRGRKASSSEDTGL